MSVLSEKLRLLRGNTSQAQIAAELGMKQPQWARYESGASSPSVDLLIRICISFGTTPNKLLGFDDNSQSVTVHGSGNTINSPNAKVSVVATEQSNCKTCPYKAAVKRMQKAGITVEGV